MSFHNSERDFFIEHVMKDVFVTNINHVHTVLDQEFPRKIGFYAGSVTLYSFFPETCFFLKEDAIEGLTPHRQMGHFPSKNIWTESSVSSLYENGLVKGGHIGMLVN